MKLSKRITILFSLAILLSIFIVSILSNQLINNNFDQYLLGEKSETVKQIGQEINEQYQEDDYKIDPDRIDSYASLEDLDINIVNLNDELLYTSRNQNRMHGMHGMPGGRSDHHEMMRERHRSNPSDQEMIEKTFDLLEGKEKVGSVSIAYIDDSIGSANALLFKETLSKILLLASVIAITIGLITSILLSKSLTKPLIKIKNTAQEIQKGHLAKKSDSKTNIIEIQELSDAINQLGQSLSEQEEIRKDYASDISHELRTPVATLKSHVEAIMDGVWEADQDHLDVLMKEIDRLSLLIDELKESFNSSTKNLVLNKKQFNLSETVNEITTTFSPVLEEKGLIIQDDIAKNIEVWMDHDRIKQVLYNLLMNAVKYSDQNGKIILSLGKVSKDKVRIKIKDQGIGIAKEDLPFIFNRLYRVDRSRTRATGGSGLGLSIVQSIIHEHGGEIQVESILDKGSSFIIDLPIGIKV